MVSKETVMAKCILRSGDVIELKYRGGGATAPDVIWVYKKTRNKKNIIIGKIQGTDSEHATISEIDSNRIKIRLTDTLFKKAQFRDYIINLNNRIGRNDGSPYNN
jgi:hypothetical protein